MTNKQEFSKGFGLGYDHFMHWPEKMVLEKCRKRLLSDLKGKVLEVGVGTGINFKYYHSDIDLIGIEPSPHMLEKAEQRRMELVSPDRFKLHNIGCSYPEMEQLIETESLDAVVVTLVLCTVPEPQKSMAKFYQWLKEGGQLVVLEHIKSHHKIGSALQNMVNPFWGRFGEGCQLNRETDELIDSTNFKLVHRRYFNMGLPFMEAVYQK